LELILYTDYSLCLGGYLLHFLIFDLALCVAGERDHPVVDDDVEWWFRRRCESLKVRAAEDQAGKQVFDS